MQYFEQWRQWLRMEEKADQEQYAAQYQHLSIAEKNAAGLIWSPLLIKGTELNRYDYITVHFERTQYLNEPHPFKAGVPAKLYSREHPDVFVEGQVVWAGPNDLRWQLKQDELPDWTSAGKLVLEPLFDANSYAKIFSALATAQKEADKHPILRVITGKQTPEYDRSLPVSSFAHLNSFQQEAVKNMVQATQLAIVHGPPGTGKTTTIVAGIQALLQAFPEEKILATAPSNAAADWLTEKLQQAGVKVLRVGNYQKVSERLQQTTLEEQLQQHPEYKKIRQYRKQASQYLDLAHQYKRHFGPAERAQRKALFQEARAVMELARQTEQYITDRLIQQAQVITGTLAGIDQYALESVRYGTVIIDEAAQALAPVTFIPILKARKLVLAGDHCQLPPVIFSEEAAQAGLSKTLMEELVEKYPAAVTLLQEQYRMHPDIMTFSSERFYNGRLIAGPNVFTGTLEGLPAALNFIDTAGTGFEEVKDGVMIANPEEAALIGRHLADWAQQADLRPYSITIITPYRGQLHSLEKMLQQHRSAGDFNGLNITLSTIDSIQGQEADIVYVSLTRSNFGREIGFLNELRRLNVAVTRAKKALLVVGDSSTLSYTDYYHRYIQFANNVNGYTSAWNWMGDASP